MEAAGVALGVVATWKTCVEVFDAIGHSRNYGADLELCRVKLEIERVRLLAWGDAVGLSEDRRSSSRPDTRLDEAQTRQVVLSVLGGIKQTFENADKLRNRYGLIESTQQPESASSSSLPSWLRKAGANLRKSGRERQQAGSLGQKTTWVVHDRARFLQMVLEIRQYNDSLAQLFPDLAIRDAIRREIGRRSDVRPLELLEEASYNDDPDISDLASQRLEELGSTYKSHSAPSRKSVDTRTVITTTTDSKSKPSRSIFGRGKKQDKSLANRKSHAGPATLEAAAAADDQEAALDALEKRMEAIHVFEAERDKGALSVALTSPSRYSAKATAGVYWLGHEVRDGLESFVTRDKGFVKSTHASFESYHRTQYFKKRKKPTENEDQVDDVFFDSEASPKYHNVNPGTVTAEGFALEVWEYEELYGIERESDVFISTWFMELSAERLLRRLDELRSNTNRLGWNPAEDHLDLHDFLGSNYDPKKASDPVSEIGELFRALNRSDLCTNFIHEASVSMKWSDPANMWKFVWQIILGKELGRRLQDGPDAWISGFTPRVLATLIISDQWLRNVQIIRNPASIPPSLKKKPESAQEAAEAVAFSNQASAALQSGKFQEAVDLYTKALETGGADAEYNRQRSASLIGLKKYPEALSDAWISKELDPQNAQAWSCVGAAYLHYGNLDPAVEAYETAMQLAGQDVDATMKQGLEDAKAKVREFNAEFDRTKDQKRKHEMAVGIRDKKWNLITNTIQFKSSVHESQVDGLLYFAEKMRWPFINEAREVAEEAYSKLHSGSITNWYLADWLYGLTLPGKHFAFKIMTALIQCSPIGETLGMPEYLDSNLVLEKQSYWRARSVLGRVLGPLPGAKSLVGWVGPMPAPEITPPSDKPFQPIFVRLKARTLAPQTPISATDENIIYIGGKYDPWKHTRPAPDEDINAYVAEMTSSEARVVPQPPVKSLSCTTVSAIRLKKFDAGSETSDNENEAEYRASVAFSVDGRNVTYGLYTNPIFVTLPTCYGGPHTAHRRELKRFQPVAWEAERLKEHSPEDTDDSEEVMLINATGTGAEILARAWCSERGRHAVVVKEGGPCLVCAMKCAEMMEIRVVIWVG